MRTSSFSRWITVHRCVVVGVLWSVLLLMKLYMDGRLESRVFLIDYRVCNERWERDWVKTRHSKKETWLTEESFWYTAIKVRI
jgi:hypothetical protein